MIGPILKDFKQVYADYFFNGELKKAKTKLEHHIEKPGKPTNNIMSCLLSASITLILVDLFLVYVINKLDKHLFVNITRSMPYLRISLAFAFCFFAARTCVKTFVKYHINYIHIFEIDYHYRLPAIDLFQTASMFLSIFSLVFTLTLMNFIRMKLDLDQNDSQKVYAFEEGNLVGLLFLMIFCAFWLNPIDCFQKH